MKQRTKLIITALNEKGHAGIKQHYDETSKVTFRNRLIFKTAGYKQEVLSKDPFTLCLHVSNMHSKNPAFLDLIMTEIKKAFSANGCEKEDYSIEVKSNG